MTLDEIKQLIELTNQTGIAELEVERGGNRVRIRRAVATAMQQEIVLQPSFAAQAAPPGSAPANGGPAEPQAAPAASRQDPALTLVKAPIVGTFYESPKPGSPAFVKAGDAVQPGQILCIIESMKLMNEIECETAGVVVARLVENGRPVEYGEALFSIRPA
jgi:acetyl-CoA carboxylase biotin carboxyl carrier protein